MTSREFQMAVQRDIERLQRARPSQTAQQRALAARAQTECPTWGGRGPGDGGRGDTEYLVACACTEAPADEAPAPVPARRRYTFAVYLEVPEPVDADDVDGYTRADVEALIKQTLASYASPLRTATGGCIADWELMDSEAVEPAAAR
jgi:hypothetical protein